MKITMKKTTMFITGVAMAFGLLLTNCKKAEQGPKGETGAQGVAGTNGTNGVANIETFVATTTNASWSLVGSEYRAVINVSAINSSVVNDGTVMVFMGNTAQTQWSPLPFAYQNVQFNYTYGYGQILLQVTLGNGATPGNPGGIPFKVVVIPPALIKSGVNVNNYEDVKAAYKLKD